METSHAGLPRKLPYARLARLSGSVEGEENLRPQGQEAHVVFFPHAACALCDEYVRTLGRGARALRDWDARPVVVVGSGEEARGRALAAAAPGVTVLEEPVGVPVRARGEIPPDSAALLVADRFSDIWHGYDMGGGHAFPGLPELEDWLRFLATQCPE